jgi:phosphomevalonate kinase
MAWCTSSQGEREWAGLQLANRELGQLLHRMHELETADAEAFTAAVAVWCLSAGGARAAAVNSKKSEGEVAVRPLCALLDAVKRQFVEVRSVLRAIGAACDVPIEPPAITSLLDATASMAGVLGCAVPGHLSRPLSC